MFQEGDLIQFDISKLPVVAGKTYKVINELKSAKHGFIIRAVMFQPLGVIVGIFTGEYVDTFLIDFSKLIFTVTSKSNPFYVSQTLDIEPINLGHNNFKFVLRVDSKYLQAYNVLEIELEI